MKIQKLDKLKESLFITWFRETRPTPSEKPLFDFNKTVAVNGTNKSINEKVRKRTHIVSKPCTHKTNIKSKRLKNNDLERWSLLGITRVNAFYS